MKLTESKGVEFFCIKSIIRSVIPSTTACLSQGARTRVESDVLTATEGRIDEENFHCEVTVELVLHVTGVLTFRCPVRVCRIACLEPPTQTIT